MKHQMEIDVDLFNRIIGGMSESELERLAQRPVTLNGKRMESDDESGQTLLIDIDLAFTLLSVAANQMRDYGRFNEDDNDGSSIVDVCWSGWPVEEGEQLNCLWLTVNAFMQQAYREFEVELAGRTTNRYALNVVRDRAMAELFAQQVHVMRVCGWKPVEEGNTSSRWRRGVSETQWELADAFNVAVYEATCGS